MFFKDSDRDKNMRPDLCRKISYNNNTYRFYISFAYLRKKEYLMKIFNDILCAIK